MKTGKPHNGKELAKRVKLQEQRQAKARLKIQMAEGKKK